MIIYLDQNKIIDISHAPSLLSELKDVLKRKKARIAISFSHIHETAKTKNNESMVRTIEGLPNIQLSALIRILDCEVRNEFYRFIGISHRDSTPIFGDIFGNITNGTFTQLVKQAGLNTHEAADIKLHNERYENTIKKALTSLGRENIKQLLSKERRGLINNYVNTYLIPKNLSMSISLPPRSLDAQEFVKAFDFSKCPYVAAYTEFQARRYINKRRNPKGDLADIEHAIHGALSCDILVIEKNACEIIKQLKKSGYSIKAKVFSDLKEAIEAK